MASWFYLLLGVALIQSNLGFSRIEVPDEEWREYYSMMRYINYRLPTTTRPRHYEITLTPYFENATNPFTFDGEVVIYISPTQANVREIVIHCNNLTIDSLTVTLSTNNINLAYAGQTFQCEKPYSFLGIPLLEALVKNQEYVIRSTFRGNLQTNMTGFYRSWYNDTTGKRWMGTTQFQRGHARKAFPCYDDPGFKATFDITINRESDYSPTISNMPIKHTITLANGRVSESFYTTPRTSTYLLAFIVSHFKVVAQNNDTNRPFYIYARDNVGKTGEWALNIGEKVLVAMEEYTQISYYNMAAHMNMKMSAIPDFFSGGMENWGLITYREYLILYDALNSNHLYKHHIANIVAHEIAHMWFGNLVTCAWWDNIWLNEGFACFYEYYLTGFVAPELGSETRFIVEQLQVALLADSTNAANAFKNMNVTNPTSESVISPIIIYAKGASVLRMTQHLLGISTYVKGLRAYLKNRSYDVAEPEHFVSALDAAAIEDNALAAYNGITIDQYFKTWSEQAGHPLLTVSVDHSTGDMNVTQSRFHRKFGVSTIPLLYHIPITWTRGGAPDFKDLKPSQIMSTQATTINRGSIGREWVIFNKQQSGFYRVNYDQGTWALITSALKSNERTVIHEYNRAQIVDDVFAMARANVFSYSEALNILSFLEFEDQYAPWIAAITGFNFLIKRLAHGPDNLQRLNELIIKKSAAIVNRLGFSETDNEPFMDGLLRMNVMKFLCNVGHQQCIHVGIQNFQNWRNGIFVPANMRPWVYCTGLRYGTADDFNYFWNRYLTENLANEKIVMLQAAGCTGVQSGLNIYLDAIVAGDEDIREQDYDTAISSTINGNENNTMRAFEWVKDNVARINTTHGSISTILNSVTRHVMNEAQISEVSAWLEANVNVIGQSSYTMAKAGFYIARREIQWYDQKVSEFVDYFLTTKPEQERTQVPEVSNSANVAVFSIVVTIIMTLTINMF